MKKIMLVFGLILALSANAMAQDDNRKGDGGHRNRPSFEQFMAEKIHFLVQEMKLNAADSSSFIAVYKQLQAEKGKLMQKHRGEWEIARKIRHGESVADSLYTKLTVGNAQLQVEDARLELEYLDHFAKVLTPKQLFDYQQAEKKFKNTFMQQRPRKESGRQKQGDGKRK